jgi:hypothetical protein
LDALTKAFEAVKAKVAVRSLRARLVERSSGKWRVEITAWGPKHPMRAEYPKHPLAPVEVDDDAAASAAVEWAWQTTANAGLEASWIEVHFKAPIPDAFDSAAPASRVERLLRIAIGARPRAWAMQKRKAEGGEVECFELKVRCEGLDSGRVFGRIAKVKPADSLHLKNWISRALESRGFYRDT